MPYAIALLLIFTACSTSTGRDASKTLCSNTPNTICTYAGTGNAGFNGDGRPLLASTLYWPVDLTITPSGTAYILDWNNHRVRVVTQGRVSTLIGTGELGDAPAGPAREIGLNHPTHISFDPQGRLVLSAWHNSMILRYDFTSDYIQPICGTGERAYGGDDGPAELALINLPSATAFDPLGRMYISDQENQRIRMIDLDGNIKTVVGTGEPGFSGDGGPAAKAQIYAPVGQSAPPTSRIAIDESGNLYLADTFNNRIRKVDAATGTITTIAGNGTFPSVSRGTLDEGAAALEVSLYWPCDLAIDSEGRIFIADTFNHCIRRIEADGQIATVADQCGVQGFAGDGGDPRVSLLNRPYGIDLDADGNLYIADTKNQRIRVVYF